MFICFIAISLHIPRKGGWFYHPYETDIIMNRSHASTRSDSFNSTIRVMIRDLLGWPNGHRSANHWPIVEKDTANILSFVTYFKSKFHLIIIYATPYTNSIALDLIQSNKLLGGRRLPRQQRVDDLRILSRSRDRQRPPCARNAGKHGIKNCRQNWKP